VALPGNNGDYSRMTVHIEVDKEGTVEYVPGETIISSLVDHRAEMHIDLAEGARARCQEMVVLGRYNETPGRLAITTHMLRAGTPLLRQQLDIAGQRLLGSAGYLAGAKVLATETIVWDEDPPESVTGPWWSLTPLAHGGALATAIAENTFTARQRLALACGHHPSGADL
jgi:urease accessory protein